MSDSSFQPAYLALYRSGELQRRAALAKELLSACRSCPRDCGVNRWQGKTAVCKSGRYARVSSYFAHFGEEDCLRGWRGSGTIFFSWCNLRCVFCQNYDISQELAGAEVLPQELAGMMLQLQEMGCHNINFVTPEHVLLQILEALPLAVEEGLRLPIVYNTSAYDAMESLQLMDGIVDIYMPDFKYWDEQRALKYLKARDYPAVAKAVLKEMQRQVGDLQVDESGLAVRGLLVRHLVMPGGQEDTAAIMRFLAEQVSPHTYVNIMEQYYPSGKVGPQKYPELNRRIRRTEYAAATSAARQAGLYRFDER